MLEAGINAMSNLNHVVMIALLSMPAMSRAADISFSTDFATSEISVNGNVISNHGAVITQSGDLNSASIDQASNAAGAGQFAEIHQTGTGNLASANQVGDINRVRITQDGSYNAATTSQNGLRNTLDLAQTGLANSLTALQNGNDNSIVATQPGGAQANLSQIGNNNSIISNQGPASPNVNVNIVGDGLSVVVNPN